jgi:hypothetical protein
MLIVPSPFGNVLRIIQLSVLVALLVCYSRANQGVESLYG